MTSILDNDSTMRQPHHVGCGGTILTGGSGEQQHQYCDRCGAYTYDLDAGLPTGTDRTANRAAYDAGDECSPDADGISRDDDTQYGSAANGLQAGSGYDVEIKRESADTALVCVTHVASKREWLTEIGVEADEDLQRRAVVIAGGPQLSDEGWAADDSEEWDHYAVRWDAIKLR